MRFPNRLAMVMSLALFATTFMLSRAESQTVTRAVFAHGAGVTGSYWGTAISQISGSFPGILMVAPTLPQSGSLSGQAGTLLSFGYMDGQSVLIGHSNGGLVSRYARANLGSGAAGIITIGTPNGGVPALFQIDWLQNTLARMVFDAVESIQLVMLDAWQQFGTYYWNVGFTASAIIAHANVLQDAQAYVSTFNAFLADDLPGSTFLTNLPSAGPNSFALNVTLGNGAGGGPLALLLSPNDAEWWGATLFALGVALDYESYQAQFELDYSRPDWYFALLRLLSAQDLAYLATNMPGLWCGVVSYPQGCVPNDGLVPVGSQLYPGALNTPITGPAHTFQPGNADVIEYIRARLLGLTS